MNHIYRVIFNAATQTWQAVSELAKAGGKGGRSGGAASSASASASASASSASALGGGGVCPRAVRSPLSSSLYSPLYLAVLGVLMLGVSAPSAAQAINHIGGGGGGGGGGSIDAGWIFSSGINGGRGGRGGTGHTITAGMTNAGIIQGGGGGGGGAGSDPYSGGHSFAAAGGGGGGLVISGSGITFTNNGTVQGGHGGRSNGFGGSGWGGYGGGGKGGLSGVHAAVTGRVAAPSNGDNGGNGYGSGESGGNGDNSGGYVNGIVPVTSYGGSGGSGSTHGSGIGSGSNGSGGVGISVHTGNATIINANKVYGGCAGSNCSAARADAVYFHTSGNTLELRAGSDIRGDVAGVSNNNTLALGGSGDSSFDVSNIGASAQYQVFHRFVKKGTSTWTLTGSTNTTTPWAIDGGTLNVGSSALGNSGTISFGGGTLQYSAGNSTDYSSRFSTAANQQYQIDTNGQNVAFASALTSSGGSLSKTGAGTLTLSGANSYTGATTIHAGAVHTNNASALGNHSAVTVNGGAELNLNDDLSIGSLAGAGNVDLDVNILTTGGDNTDTIYSGEMSGTGGLVKSGAGTFTLSGNHTYSGATHINGGRLNVNGSIDSIANVNNGGTIGGTGTVGDLIVHSGGIAAPGNSIGTLRVNGDVTFNAGSVYQVETDPTGNSDRIDATGTATLNGGTVDVRAGSGYNTATRYTILTSGGRTGTFANATSDMAFLEPVLTYDPNNVYLNLNRNNRYFADLANSFNQRQVAAMLDNTATGNPVLQAVVQLNAAQARQAYDDVSGEIHNSVHSAMVQDSVQLHQVAHHHTQPTNGSRLWGKLLGYNGKWKGDGNAHTLKRNGVGAVFGYDLPLASSWRVGLMAGFGRSHYKAPAVHSTAKANHIHMGAYAGRDWQQGDNTLKLKADVAYTWSDIDVSREVHIGQGFNNALKSSYKNHTVQAHGELAYAIGLQRMTIEPYAGLSVVNSRRAGFRETGGAAALSSKAHSTSNVFANAGVRLEKTFGNSGSRLYADMGVRHAMKAPHVESTHQFASGGNAFKVRGNSSGKTVGAVHVGVDYHIKPAAIFTLNANAAVGSGYKDYGAHIGFRWGF